MQPLYLTRVALVNALGRGIAATLAALRERQSGLRPCDLEYVDLDTYVGRVDGLESLPVARELSEYDCRNNRLAQLGLQQDGFESAVARAREQYGDRRIGVFIGTSTSGILEIEMAYQNRDPDTGALPSTFRYRYTHNIYSAADFVQRYLRLRGPALAISTACSSSAKVFATAHRFVEAGLCDAAVVGGVDSLCMTTLYGFSSLELVSARPCRPADREREGISIGEAAGYALLERIPEPRASLAVALLGYGESSDAYHMSSPHPEGLGAVRAMEGALERAGLKPRDIDYINLHGTATPANDIAEDRAVCEVFDTGIPCSSTKGWTGHTLGAAGITEAIISWLCIQNGFVPGSLNTEVLDPQLRSHITLQNRSQKVQRVITNSFGFGGNNCSIILGTTG